MKKVFILTASLLISISSYAQKYFPNGHHTGDTWTVIKDGEKSYFEQNNDGTVTIHFDKHSCWDCYGAGKCSMCNGTGGKYDYYLEMYDWCSYCNRTGICPSCKGQGWEYGLASFTVYPVKNFPQYKDNPNYYMTGYQGYLGFYTGNNYMSSDSYGGSPSSKTPSNTSSSNYTSKYQTCVMCNGSGKCHDCGGKGTKWNRYTSSYYECSLCKVTGTCSFCHGRGKKYYD